jgi:hypothetical protein
MTDKIKLQDPELQRQFTNFIWQQRERVGGDNLFNHDPNDISKAATDIMRQGQDLFFSPDSAQSNAKEPWASSCTVALADRTPALRSLHVARANLKESLVALAFHAWTPRLFCKVDVCYKWLRWNRQCEAWHLSHIRLHRSTVSASITSDLNVYVAGRAQQAKSYAEAGDLACVFKITKLLRTRVTSLMMQSFTKTALYLLTTMKSTPDGPGVGRAYAMQIAPQLAR